MNQRSAGSAMGMPEIMEFYRMASDAWSDREVIFPGQIIFRESSTPPTTLWWIATLTFVRLCARLARSEAAATSSRFYRSQYVAYRLLTAADNLKTDVTRSFHAE
jgi:hypothetical protein